MNKLLLIALIFSAPAMAVPTESNSQFAGVDKNDTKLLNALAGLVVESGYKCDSISAAMRSSWDGNFTLRCNGFRYKYLIEDKGGNWTVTLD
jgi:hypothetical protein